MSQNATAGAVSRTLWTASSAVSASTTWYPAGSRNRRITSRTFASSSTISTCDIGLLLTCSSLIEHFANLLRQSVRRKRLLEKRRPFAQHAMVHDRVIRVTGHVEDRQAWSPGAQPLPQRRTR